MSQSAPVINLKNILQLAQARSTERRYGEAIRLYHFILDQNPDNFDASMALGHVHQMLGTLHKAAYYYRTAARLMPEAWFVRYHLGYVLIRLGLYSESLDHLHAVAEFGPETFPHVDRLYAYAKLRSAGQTVASFEHEGRAVRFAIDGDNVGLDMFYANGEFFEQAELEYARQTVSDGAVIVDIGANTGNNLVYYARFMSHKVIYPIEPHPGAIDSLLRNIRLNALKNIDQRFLGIGLGHNTSRMNLARDQAGDLVTTRLVNSSSGTIEVRPLDGLIDQPIDFLKVDVEGMELAVLLGARQTLAMHRPIIMVEVQNSRDDAFQKLIGQLGYYVKNSFVGEGYKNYFIKAH